MQASEAAVPQNQIAFSFMSESQAVGPGADPVSAGFATDFPARKRDESGTGFAPVLAVMAAAGAALIALVVRTTAEPVLLTMLAALAMLGAFFVFSLLAGHIRLGARVGDSDLIRAMADGFAKGVLVTAGDGTPVYANRMYAEFAGRDGPDSIRRLDTAFAGETEATAALYRLMRLATRGQAGTEIFETGISSAKARRLIKVSSQPLSVPGHERNLGNLALWTIADITDERADETARVSALETQLSLYDGGPAGFIAADANGTITHLNSAFAGWLGGGLATPRGRGAKLGEIIASDGIELLRSAARQPPGSAAGTDLDVICDNGRIVPMRFFSRSSTSGGLVISAFNRQADEALAASLGSVEIRFARFFQSAPFGIATVSADGRIASTNGAFARMVIDGAKGVGEAAADVLCRADDAVARKAIEAGLKQVLAGRSPAGPIEITVGAERQFARRVYITPLARSGEGREAAILYVIDATEQKALEAKFAQSSKMEAVGNLAGGIAHDFNNVLTAIIGFSDLLLQTHRPADPAYRDIMNIRSSANRAAGLVAKLLAFSRRQTLQSEPLQLGELLTDLAPLLKRSIGEKIELKMPTGRDLWYVKADKTQFEQVVINLAVNAKDAMADGGTLTVRTRNITERDSQKLKGSNVPLGEYVALEVEDTGTGMTPEVLAKIFEPFFTTKGVGKGTGLGLATVYGIVKQSGGYIYPDSEPGRGTTFRVYLPRHIPDNEEELVAQKAAKKEPLPADLTGTGRVLLVEDEDIVRSFAVRALKRQGYEVLEASTGVEALEVMERINGDVDIVVSDVVMPEMDGPTLLKRLRKKNPDIKIIFVSGYPHEAFETSLDKDQQFAFLPKPFSLPQLAAKVKEELAK